MVTTPANTAVAAAISTSWTPGPGVLAKLDVVIPSGHVGLTGLQVLWGGRQILPYEAADFLAGNGDEITVELGLDMWGRTIAVRTYNLDDAFAHSHYLRAYMVDRAPGFSGLFGPEPALGFEPGVAPAPFGGPGLELTDEEMEVVSTALDGFLASLQGILDGFLAELDARLGGAPAGPPEEPAPEEGAPPPPEPPPSPRPVVPDVIGQSLQAGRSALRAAGFGVDVTRRREKGHEVIVDQRPRAGVMRAAGSTVAITVRVNPRAG